MRRWIVIASLVVAATAGAQSYQDRLNQEQEQLDQLQQRRDNEALQQQTFRNQQRQRWADEDSGRVIDLGRGQREMIEHQLDQLEGDE
jgi:hypothetical protein